MEFDGDLFTLCDRLIIVLFL